jgi:hypothetical protein
LPTLCIRVADLGFDFGVHAVVGENRGFEKHFLFSDYGVHAVV